MRVEENVAKALGPLISPVPEEQRRRAQRTKHPKPVRVRPSGLPYDEEVRTTLNACRGGLFFATWEEHYYVGMPLLITFLDADANPDQAEYSAEIVRIVPLGPRQLGIAVRFLSADTLTQAPRAEVAFP